MTADAPPPQEQKPTHAGVAQQAFKDLGQAGFFVQYSADESDALSTDLPPGMVALLHLHVLITLGRLGSLMDYDTVLRVILR